MEPALAEPPPWVREAIQRHEAALTRFAARIVGDRERARDVVQDTFVRLFEADPATVSQRMPQWLYTVCRNRALDVVRKQGRRERLVGRAPRKEDGPSADLQLERRQLLARVLAVVDELPEKQATVLRLKLSRGLSYQEIADETGLTSSYVGYLLHHALKTVRAEVGGRDDG